MAPVGNSSENDPFRPTDSLEGLEMPRVGYSWADCRVFTQDDFDRFAALSGDDNPIHWDADFAARTKFHRPVAHGMLLYSIVCAAISERFPWFWQVAQDLMFPAPTYASEEVTVRLLVTAIERENSCIHLSTSVARPDGSLGLQGEASIVPLRLGKSCADSKPEPDSIAAAPLSGLHLAEGKAWRGLTPGLCALVSRSFSRDDLAEYVDLIEDHNPVVRDATQARQAGLDDQPVPGGLIGGMFSHLLGTNLPGPGTNYLKQRLRFTARPTSPPDQWVVAYPDQPLRASVEVIKLRPEKQLVNLRTECLDPSGRMICQGEALVLVSDVPQN